MQILCHTRAMGLSHVNYMYIVKVIKIKIKGKYLPLFVGTACFSSEEVQKEDEGKLVCSVQKQPDLNPCNIHT